MKAMKFNLDNKQITTLLDSDNNIWFIAREICKELNYTNTSNTIKKNCNKKGISMGYTPTKGGKQKSILINEANLCRLIMRSTQKNAIKFQDWVVEEVLPCIRKTGEYSIPKTLNVESTKSRNILTDAWKECGIEKPHHFIQLTLQEYKTLGLKKGKRKNTMTKKEIALLRALESMEYLKLFETGEMDYYKCRDSLHDTGRMILSLSDKKEVVSYKHNK